MIIDGSNIHCFNAVGNPCQGTEVSLACMDAWLELLGLNGFWAFSALNGHEPIESLVKAVIVAKVLKVVALAYSWAKG